MTNFQNPNAGSGSGKRGRKANPALAASKKLEFGYRETALAVPALDSFRAEVSNLQSRVAKFDNLDDRIQSLEAKLAEAKADKLSGIDPIRKRLEVLAAVPNYVAGKIRHDSPQSLGTAFAERIGKEASTIYSALAPAEASEAMESEDSEESED